MKSTGIGTYSSCGLAFPALNASGRLSGTCGVSEHLTEHRFALWSIRQVPISESQRRRPLGFWSRALTLTVDNYSPFGRPVGIEENFDGGSLISP